MKTRNLLSAAAAAALLATVGRPAEVAATCDDPTSEAPLASTSLGGVSTASNFPHPLLEQTAVMAGTDLNLVSFDMKTTELIPVGTTTLSNPTIANLGDGESGEYAAFIAGDSGIVARVDLSTGNVPWSTDMRRAACPDDTFLAAPVVQVRRYSSAAFQAAYSDDVVYVATAHGCADGATSNRIYALSATTGAILWTFNELGSVDMDVVSAAPVLDIENDLLVVASDRSASPTQDSLWGIDVLTGTAAWAASVGRLVNAPVLRDDRIYVGDRSGYIRALNREDGTVIWSLRASWYGFESNVFAEFRPPYEGLIAASDRLGNVVLVSDDDFSGSKLWSAKPGGGSALASSQVGIDPENGKIFVGANDGYLYQLSIIDGTTDASRLLDSSGSSIGAASFTFEDTDDVSGFDDIRLIAGSAAGEFQKLCYPWATAGATPAVGGFSSVAPDACGTASDCGAAPSQCAEWSCENKVCVPVPLPDGTGCETARAKGTCNSGVCSPVSDCDEALDQCTCVDDDGNSVSRILLVEEKQAQEYQQGPGDADPVNSPITAVTTTNMCLTIGSVARSAVSVHLIDQYGRPFRGADVTFTMESLGGTLPVWRDPETGQPRDGESVRTGAGIVEAGRQGTYYGILSPPSTGTAALEGVKILAKVNGPYCATGQVETIITTAAPAQEGRGGCPLLSDAGEAGYLEVTVTLEGKPINEALVTVGHARDERAFYSSYKPFIDSEDPGDRPNFGKTGETGQEGKVVFRDYGNKLNGPTPVRVQYGGEFDFVVPDVDTSQLTIELTNPPKEQLAWGRQN